MHSNEVMKRRRNGRRNSMNGVQRSWHGVNEIYTHLPTFHLYINEGYNNKFWGCRRSFGGTWRSLGGTWRSAQKKNKWKNIYKPSGLLKGPESQFHFTLRWPGVENPSYQFVPSQLHGTKFQRLRSRRA